MAVKIFIKRQIKKENRGDASALLIMARKNAMNHHGYISTETLVNYDDPCQIVVVSMWQKKEDWDAYVRSSERKENGKELCDDPGRRHRIQEIQNGDVIKLPFWRISWRHGKTGLR